MPRKRGVFISLLFCYCSFRNHTLKLKGCTMTPEKVLEVIETYRQLFIEKGIGKIDYPHNDLLDRETHGLEHCHGMLDKMVEFVREKRMEKVFRWLGFIQGVLWTTRVYPLTNLKDHNRPPEG